MGRIGRLLFKLLMDNEQCELVAVNDIMEAENILYLLKYDSISGPYQGSLDLQLNKIISEKRSIAVLNSASPAALPWKQLAVDLVVECTGGFTSRKLAEQHLEAGAKKVLLSTTGSSDLPLLIWGVNHQSFPESENIISPGGCMTNCSSVILSSLMALTKVESVQLNVLHSYTSRQSLVDGPHRNFRRGRAAATSIIPVEIDLAKTLERLFPELKERVATTSTRVPIDCGALADFSIVLSKKLTLQEIHSWFRNMAEGAFHGILQYNEELIVSNDIIGNPHSAILDASLSSLVGNHLKLQAWFDNEFGYTNRLMDIITSLAGK